MLGNDDLDGAGRGVPERIGEKNRFLATDRAERRATVEVGVRPARGPEVRKQDGLGFNRGFPLAGEIFPLVAVSADQSMEDVMRKLPVSRAHWRAPWH